MTGRVSRAPGEIRTAVLMSHSEGENTRVAAEAATDAAEQAGCRLIAAPEELEKYPGLAGRIEVVDPLPTDPDLCVVLGGDGSILRGLRVFGATSVPVFGINYGTIGFLAAVEREELDHGLQLAFAGDFDVMELPGLELGIDTGAVGLNDVSFSRQPHRRVAGRRSGTSAVTASWPRLPPDPPATTSRTRAPCWRGAWRATR